MKKTIKTVVAIALMVASLGFVTEGLAAEKKEKLGTADKPLKVTVSSLKELLPYFEQSYVNLTMTPGVYRITTADAKAGMYDKTIDVSEGQFSHPLLFVEGSNNTFDFTGVTIEVESQVINSYPGKHSGVTELHIIGNNNVVKNLRLLDIGTENDFPNRGWVNAIVDGANNRLEGMYIHSKGSKPYGYGEAFGKGKGYVLKHWKHSSLLVRGDDNHIKACTLMHHAYGHYLFMQGARNATIEGCYIEGKMTSTDTILAEKGSGSSADKIDFKTVWGYTLPAGHTLCLGEDGIRTYTEGNTIVNGERMRRRTGGNIVVKDCTVKHARSGVALALGEGSRYVENCTLIGCQHGYSVNGGGKIVNCRADAAFGEAFSVNYPKNGNITADITIIPYNGEPYAGNGSKQVAKIQGSGHNLTFKAGEGLRCEEGMQICVGGDNRIIGSLDKDENMPANKVTLINETGFEVLVDDNASNSTITSKGKVTDNGTNNTIKQL
ncbi:MAG: right-handed parallel beta-helix repeat-containing protein [Rikenellaceae bacterium]